MSDQLCHQSPLTFVSRLSIRSKASALMYHPSFCIEIYTDRQHIYTVLSRFANHLFGHLFHHNADKYQRFFNVIIGILYSSY